MSGAKTATPLHDDDGNVTDYKNMKYSWNAENQLVSSEPKTPAEGDKKTEYLYDYMGRRARKQIYVYSSGAWTKTTEKLFVYDGWNLIKEITKEGVSSSDKFYVWGLDLSQSLQGAGGIGGLVCAVHAGEVRHFFYDGNGNVGQVVNADGSIAAHYEYDPFGNIVNGVPQSDDNPFRFSTKYFDAETGLYYYGFRDYSAELGRWWSRDPIGEKGGVNLYLSMKNHLINIIDYIGLFTIEDAKKALKADYIKANAEPPYMVAGGEVNEEWFEWTSKVDTYMKELPKQKIFDKWYEMEKSNMEWLKNIPKCPKKLCLKKVEEKGKESVSPQNPDKNKWKDPEIMGSTAKMFHPDAYYEMRSQSFGDGCGNQCTYDKNGDIIKDGKSAGTADRQAPLSIAHFNHDVETFILAAQLDGNSISASRTYTFSGSFTILNTNVKKYIEVRPSYYEE